MMELLLSASVDAVLEATRVFGNLSQSKDVRNVIMQHKGETDARCSLQAPPPAAARWGVWAELICKAAVSARLSQLLFLPPPIILLCSLPQRTALW